ncbi:MAG: PDZ domain-containing protein, partial [Rhizobacter sp.]|nr:PDZ domain-containing protein [Chlorobiales bacterium]
MMISVPAHRSRLTLTLLCDAALLLLFIAGVYQIKEKAGLDAVLSEKIGGVFVEETGSGSAMLRKGDRLLSFNGQAVSQVGETEFLCDALRAGDIVQLGIRRGGTRMMIMQPLARFYSDRYIAVVITVGLIFFLLAVFVVWRRPEDDAAHLLHWAFLSIAAMIFLTFGRYTVEPSGLGHVVRLMFIGSYSFASPLFIHFTYLFPKKKWTQVNRLMWPLYAFILILTIATGILFLMATVPASLPNLAAFRRFMSLFDGCRWLMSLGVFFGIGNLVHSYRTENSTAARKKLRWTFLGMGLGPLGFILLWQTPQSLGMPALVPEELVLLTVGLTPIAMAISIVRYQILNIDIVLNRGTVYGLMFGIALLLYGAIVAVATALFTLVIGQANGVVPTAVAAVAIALLFEPIRLRVQRFVDRRFFRVHYDLQAAQNLFIAQIKETVSEEALAELVVSRADELLKPERAGFFKFSKPHARLELVAHRNFSENNQQSLRFDLARLTSALEKPIGQEDKL